MIDCELVDCDWLNAWSGGMAVRILQCLRVRVSTAVTVGWRIVKFHYINSVCRILFLYARSAGHNTHIQGKFCLNISVVLQHFKQSRF